MPAANCAPPLIRPGYFLIISLLHLFSKFPAFGSLLLFIGPLAVPACPPALSSTDVTSNWLDASRMAPDWLDLHPPTNGTPFCTPIVPQTLGSSPNPLPHYCFSTPPPKTACLSLTIIHDPIVLSNPILQYPHPTKINIVLPE